MADNKIFSIGKGRAIGLMSGTSMDGVDAAYIVTDGLSIQEFGPSLTLPYKADFRERLRNFLESDDDRSNSTITKKLEADLTMVHADAVRQLYSAMGLSCSEAAQAIDIIGFHGHTILHCPQDMLTWQLGDGAKLASVLRIPVVNEFRSQDVNAGGQGAPLAPIFHMALVAKRVDAIAILNIGGIANVTWCSGQADIPNGTDSSNLREHLLGFDVGPGNALIDDWIYAHTGKPMDRDGRIAKLGRPDKKTLQAMLEHPYFLLEPPKSLDRYDFTLDAVRHLSLEDGAATLTAFTAACVSLASKYFPSNPRLWLVTGGGRRNAALFGWLSHYLEAPVHAIEHEGWDGDALEAQAFGYLAVRAFKKLPITFPSTTHVSVPLSGGSIHYPN